MAFLPFIGPVFNVLDEVLKRVLPPEKMSEADRAKLSQDLQLALMKQDWSSVEKEYQDRADARSLAKADVDKGNWFSNVLAATVRPVWGYGVLVLFAYSIVSPALKLPPVPLDDNARAIMQTVIMFFFGGRTIEKVLTTITEGKTAVARNGNGGR